MKWKCPKCGREFSRQNQDHFCVKPQNIDEYIAAQDEKIQPRLNEIRSVLRAALPDAEERISWSMPTYWKGKNIIHFAAFKKHIGTIRLPHDRELPVAMIERIAKWCYEEYRTGM